jgi:hypothetical protein
MLLRGQVGVREHEPRCELPIARGLLISERMLGLELGDTYTEETMRTLGRKVHSRYGLQLLLVIVTIILLGIVLNQSVAGSYFSLNSPVAFPVDI